MKGGWMLVKRQRKERHAAQTYTIGGSLGDRIEWFPADQFKKPNTHFTVAGWKRRKPRVGDYLEGQFGKGLARFQFTEIENTGDPPDMFFGTVAFIGYAHELD
jgi:hypothetical protein